MGISSIIYTGAFLFKFGFKRAPLTKLRYYGGLIGSFFILPYISAVITSPIINTDIVKQIEDIANDYSFQSQEFIS